MYLMSLLFFVFLCCVAAKTSQTSTSEKCLNTFTNPIDISNCNVTELDPRKFEHHHHITSLDMSFNRQFEFPPDGSPFLFHPSLLHYYCESCGITGIYEKTFSELRQLKLLNLRGNRIKSIPVAAFNYNRIHFLNLANNQIRTFNEQHKLETMQHLLKLNVSGNEGFELNDLSIDFSSLEWVICQRCELKFLIETWFEQVKRLKKLDLECNLIQEVPKNCFSKNLRLQRINLSENRIRWMDIRNSYLEVLICNNCDLEEVSEITFKELPNLKMLELSHNQIKKVEPAAFVSNMLLNKLNLYHNNLTSFPFEILRTSRSLEALCLDHNLFYPHEDFNSFKHLYKALNLRKQCASGYNPLYHFENVMPDVSPEGTFLYTKEFPTCHEMVNISHQNVVFIHPMAYENCSEFKILEMNGNANYAFPEYRSFLYSEFLEIYSCNHCGINALYPETFAKLPRLTNILLRNNHLDRIASLDIFTSLRNLQFIDLNHNRLQLLPTELLSSHKYLKMIELSHNPDLWHQLNLPILEQSSVTFLDASHCRIDRVKQATFSLMPALAELDISHNPIEVVDSSAFESNSGLRILHITHTHLHVFPAVAVEHLKQMKRLCLYGMKRYVFDEDSFRENNERLGILIRDRKLSCQKGEAFMERLLKMAKTTAVPIELHIENGAVHLQQSAVLTGVLMYLINKLLTLYVRLLIGDS